MDRLAEQRLPSMNSDLSIFETAARLAQSAEPFVLAIVVNSQGSTSAPVGSMAILSAEGQVLAGWIGGGCAASTVGFAAVEALKEKQARFFEVDLDDPVLGAGLGCGGKMTVFVAPQSPAPTLWIIGGGRIAESLCALAAEAGFSVNVLIEQSVIEGFVRASSTFSSIEALDGVAPDDFVVLLSQSFRDQEILERLSRIGPRHAGPRYVGLLASRKRSNTLRESLAKAGCDSSFLPNLRAPVGLDLNAKTPAEIALEIVAEIVKVKRANAESNV